MKLVKTSDLHAGFSNETLQKHQRFFSKVATEKPDVLVLAGDNASHRQKSLRTLFRTVRDSNPTVPVVCCWGNHDFWETPKSRSAMPSYEQLVAGRQAACDEYNILHVDKGPYIIDNVAIVGFDGWYWHLDPPTNDKLRMPKEAGSGEPLFSFLTSKAHTDLERILLTDLSAFRKRVCITHFPPFVDNIAYQNHTANRNYFDFLSAQFDVVLVGHSHKQADFVATGCRWVNAGSDYDAPKYVVLDL